MEHVFDSRMYPYLVVKNVMDIVDCNGLHDEFYFIHYVYI